MAHALTLNTSICRCWYQQRVNTTLPVLCTTVRPTLPRTHAPTECYVPRVRAHEGLHGQVASGELLFGPGTNHGRLGAWSLRGCTCCCARYAAAATRAAARPRTMEPCSYLCTCGPPTTLGGSGGGRRCAGGARRPPPPSQHRVNVNPYTLGCPAQSPQSPDYMVHGDQEGRSVRVLAHVGPGVRHLTRAHWGSGC